MKPYINESETRNEIFRIFKEDIDPIELKWHRDLENRTIDALENTDWMIQLDNKLPEKIENVKILAGEWHRVIKGTGDLKIKIIKDDDICKNI